MPVERQTSVVETQSKITGFPESIQGARNLDAAFTGVSESSKKISGAVIDVAAQIDRLDSKYDASIKTANEVARVQGLIAAAREQGGQDEEQYARVLANALAAHEAALQKVSGAANDNTQSITRMAAAGRQATESVQQQTSAVQALANAWAGLKPTGIDTATRAADIRAYSDALDGLAAKFNPMVAAEQKLARETAELNTAFANFEINILDLERGLQGANAAFQKSAAAVRNYYTEIEKASAKTAAAAQQKINTQLFGQPSRADEGFFQNRQDDLNAYGDALDNLRARVNPLYAAEREFTRAVEEANLALRSGLVTVDEHAAQLKRLQSGYDNTVASIHGAGNAATASSKNFGLASHQLQNLGFQLNDLVVQIGSGGGIFRPLLQQGAQIQQILSMSEGGVGGVLKKVAASIKEIGPSTLATRAITVGSFTAIAAAIGTAIAAAVEFQEQQVEIQRALKGTGRGAMAGLQERDIQSAASAASATAEISTAAARSAAIEIARTGKIGKEVLTGLTSLTADYAKILGVDTVEAAKKLATAFADPAKGAAALAEELNFLSAAEIEQVAAMARTGNILGAQRLLFQKTEQQVAQNKVTIDTLAKAWEALGNVAKNAADKVVQAAGRALSPPTPEEMLENLQGGAKPDTAKRTRRLTAQQGPQGATGLDQETRLNELRAQTAEKARQEEEKRLNSISRAAQGITDALDPTIKKFEEMQGAVTKLQAGLAQPQRLENFQATADVLERIQDQLGGATDAYGMYAVALERQARAHQLALDAINATTLAEQASVAGKQAALALEGQATLATERRTAELRAQELVIAQANATTTQQLAQGALRLQQIQVETQATLAQTDAERQAALVAQADLAFQQAYTQAITARLGPENALLLAEQQRNLVMQQGAAARTLRMAQAEQEIAQGARELAQQKLNIQSQLAYTAAQQRAAAEAQAAAAAQEAYRQAIEKGYGAKKAAILAEQAHAKVMAEFEAKVDQAVAAANRLIAANNLQIKAIQAKTVAERADIAAQQSMEATEGSLMTMTQRLKLAEQERLKVLEQSKAAVQQMITAQEGEIRLLEASISSINMEKGARAELLAGIRAENQLIAMGIDLNSDYAQTYIRNAEAIAKMTVQLERAEAAANNLNSAMKKTHVSALGTLQSFGKTMEELVEGKGGFQMQELPFAKQMREEAEKNAQARTEREAANAPGAGLPATEERRAYKSIFDMAAEIAGNTAATTDAIKDVDLGDIGTEIDRLRDLQEAALSRAYKPDPYAERNPEFFYNGEKIMKEGQDRIFDGLQTQIEKLQGLRESVGTLVAQGAALPQTLVNALYAAGFGNIANDIANALTAQSAPSVTPNPTATMWDSSGSGVSTPASTSTNWSAKGFTLTPEYLANLNQSSFYTRAQLKR